MNTNPQVEYVKTRGAATVDLDPKHDNMTRYSSSKSGRVSEWAWGEIQAYNTRDLATGSSAVRIVGVDIGMDNSHPDLPLVVAQRDFVKNDCGSMEPEQGAPITIQGHLLKRGQGRWGRKIFLPCHPLADPIA